MAIQGSGLSCVTWIRSLANLWEMSGELHKRQAIFLDDDFLEKQIL